MKKKSHKFCCMLHVKDFFFHFITTTTTKYQDLHELSSWLFVFLLVTQFIKVPIRRKIIIYLSGDSNHNEIVILLCFKLVSPWTSKHRQMISCPGKTHTIRSSSSTDIPMTTFIICFIWQKRPMILNRKPHNWFPNVSNMCIAIDNKIKFKTNFLCFVISVLCIFIMLPLDDAQIKFVCKSFDLYWNFHENEQALSDSGKWIWENMLVVFVFRGKNVWYIYFCILMQFQVFWNDTKKFMEKIYIDSFEMFHF